MKVRGVFTTDSVAVEELRLVPYPKVFWRGSAVASPVAVLEAPAPPVAELPPEPVVKPTGVGIGGIDVGKKGFISVIDGSKVLLSVKTPMIGDNYDIPALWQIALKLKEMCAFVLLEQQFPMGDQGPLGNFTTGGGFYLWQGLLMAAGVPHEIVAPAKWKQAMGIAAEKVRKDPDYRKKLTWAKQHKKIDPGAKAFIRIHEKEKRELKKKGKDRAIVKAQRMFPGFDLRENPRCKVAHDGKAESLLLAHYARRQFLGAA